MLEKIPYGKGYLEVELPDDTVCLSVSEGKIAVPGEEKIKQALNSLYDHDFSFFKGKTSVGIATSDETRPVPNALLIPLLFEKLAEQGVKEKDVTIYIGTGLHHTVNDEEMERIVGQEVFSRFRCVTHDAWDKDNLVTLGTTEAGTPIEINKSYFMEDAKIVLGVIDPHQFAGFSGGLKGVSIGLGSDALVNANHSMLVLPGAELGNIEGNPLRKDIDEIGRVAAVDFMLNVVLNSKKEIAGVFAGDVIKAHRAGIETAKKVLQVEIEKPADIVIAGSGGYPKDLNLYQAQKGLLHAAIAVKEGGTIILAAECRDGVGEKKFSDMMARGDSPAGIIEVFKKSPFMVGAHKAYLWCASLVKARTILVSDGIDAETAALMQVEKASSLEEALAMASENMENFSIYTMPKASSTIPLLKR